MLNSSIANERMVEKEPSKFSFFSPDDINSKHSLQVISSLFEGNNGSSDISFDGSTCLYITPISHMEQQGDKVLMYTEGAYSGNRGIVLQAYPPQRPLLGEFGPVEISSPNRITLVEERDLRDEGATFEDLNMIFSFRQEEEGKVFFSVLSTKIDMYDDLAPIENIEMVSDGEGRFTFGLNNEGHLLGDEEGIAELKQYIRKCTGLDSSLNGIRPKDVSLVLDAAKVRLGISV